MTFREAECLSELPRVCDCDPGFAEQTAVPQQASERDHLLPNLFDVAFVVSRESADECNQRFQKVVAAMIYFSHGKPAEAPAQWGGSAVQESLFRQIAC